MPYEFRLPDIGEGVVEGEIVKWHVRPGQDVKEDDPMVEVMTDKATVMIPSPRKGKILETRGEEGSIVKVGAVLVTLETGDGAASAAVPVSEKQPPKAEAARPEKKEQKPAGRSLATPAIRKLAQDMGIDINIVEGSGPGGRVTREDLESHAKGAARQETKPGAPPPAARTRPAAAAKSEQEEIPLRGLRKRIAEKMAQSKQHAAHYTYVEEIDMTELVRLRKSAAGIAEDRGIKLTYLPFIIKAVVAGLKKYELLNATLDEQAGKIILKRYYNIGIGVATPEGLTVVVVKKADSKAVFDIAEEIARFSAEARENRVALEDLKGSTFTITSLGPLGGMLATPIINYPEVGILGIHKIEQRPVVRDGQIVIRDMMYMSLSFDHRVVDGAVGAEFCAYVKHLLENPNLLFLQ